MRILDSALVLFSRQGYGATSVREIAVEAGVSQGLMYNYFSGKEGLLRAALERSMEEIWASFERAAELPTPRDQLEALPRETLAGVRANRAFWRLSYQLRMKEEVAGGIGREILEWSNAIRARMERLFEAAGSVDSTLHARVLFAAIDGAAQQLVLDPSGYPEAEVAREIAQRLLPEETAQDPPGFHPPGGHP